MRAPLGASLNRSAQGDKPRHFVFLVQVLFFSGKGLAYGHRVVRSYEEMKIL